MSWKKTRGRNVDGIAERKRQYNSAEYRHARQAAKQRVDAGGVNCWRCRKPIHPRQQWHLGHDDNDRRIIHGPEHAQCNLSAAARKGHRLSKKANPATQTETKTQNWRL